MDLEPRIATLEAKIEAHDKRIEERKKNAHKANGEAHRLIEKVREDVSDIKIKITQHDGQIGNIINLYKDLKEVVEGNTTVITAHNKIMLKAEGGVKTGIGLLKALFITGLVTLCTFIVTMIKLFEFWKATGN